MMIFTLIAGRVTFGGRLFQYQWIMSVTIGIQVLMRDVIRRRERRRVRCVTRNRESACRRRWSIQLSFNNVIHLESTGAIQVERCVVVIFQVAVDFSVEWWRWNSRWCRWRCNIDTRWVAERRHLSESRGEAGQTLEQVHAWREWERDGRLSKCQVEDVKMKMTAALTPWGEDVSQSTRFLVATCTPQYSLKTCARELCGYFCLAHTNKMYFTLFFLSCKFILLPLCILFVSLVFASKVQVLSCQPQETQSERVREREQRKTKTLKNIC